MNQLEPDPEFDAARARLLRRTLDLASSDGVNTTILESVQILRWSQPRRRVPVLYEPQMVFAAQGCKRVYVGSQMVTYNPSQLLLLSVPLPVEGEIPVATREKPYLAVKVAIQTKLVAELMTEMGQPGYTAQVPAVMERGLRVAPMDPALTECVVRLLEACRERDTGQILGPGILREIHFRVLRGPQGHALRALVWDQVHLGQIARVLYLIHGSPNRAWDVPSLALEARMSTSTFYHHFKSVTSLSPLNYVKSLRLHRARSLMSHEGLTAGEAAFQVGYASASQFSREFKRMFGRPPREDAAANRTEGIVLTWPNATLGR